MRCISRLASFLLFITAITGCSTPDSVSDEQVEAPTKIEEKQPEQDVSSTPEIPGSSTEEKASVELRSQTELDALSDFTEAELREIFDARLAAERRAVKESEEIYPLPDPLSPGYSAEQFNEKLDQQTEKNYFLRDKYQSEVMQKYGINREQLDKAAVYGLERGWMN